MQDWKKSSPQDCVSPRGHFAPRLFLLSSSFSKINSSAKIRMALKRHTVLYRLTLRRPLRRKLWMRWFFDVSKVKESSFFYFGPHWPTLRFLMRSTENTDLCPSRFYFSVGFISRSCFDSDGFIAYSNEWDWREKTMFIHTNQPLITSIYIKSYLFFLPN